MDFWSLFNRHRLMLTKTGRCCICRCCTPLRGGTTLRTGWIAGSAGQAAATQRRTGGQKCSVSPPLLATLLLFATEYMPRRYPLYNPRSPTLKLFRPLQDTPPSHPFHLPGRTSTSPKHTTGSILQFNSRGNHKFHKKIFSLLYSK